MNEQFYSWTFKFCIVVWQQISHLRGGRYYSNFCSSSAKNESDKLLKLVHISQSYHKKTVWVFFDSRYRNDLPQD